MLVVVVLLFMFVALLFPGMVIAPVSMILITAPIFFPLAITQGDEPLWFGLFVLICLEMSQMMPPPFGLLLYVMLGQRPRARHGVALRWPQRPISDATRSLLV